MEDGPIRRHRRLPLEEEENLYCDPAGQPDPKRLESVAASDVSQALVVYQEAAEELSVDAP